MNTISFDYKLGDYIVNGKPLLQHLQKHEEVNANDHVPAVLVSKGASDRLMGIASADLTKKHISLYLCSHCGGYDGSVIGVHLDICNDTVRWSNIGFHSDCEKEYNVPFKKVREFNFGLQEYKIFISEVAIYEPRA